MAIFDFLNSKQTGTQNVTTSIDPQIKQAYLANLNFADTVASRPYQQYGGPRIAGFSPDQESAFGAIRGMQGAGMPYLQGAGNTFQNLMGFNAPTVNAGSFLSGNVGAYQNPYTSQVIDQTMNDLNRQRAIDQQGLNAQAAKSGAFGGSRQAVAQAEMNRNYNDQFARTAAQLRNQGFDTAANLMQNDLNRGLQAQGMNQGAALQSANTRMGAAGAYGGLGQQMQNMRAQDINALMGAGQMQQAQTQRNYDLANQDFQNQFNYPLQQLAIRQGALGAAIPNTGQTQSTPIYQNPVGNFVGGLGAVNSLLSPGQGQPSFLSGIASGIGKGLTGVLDFDQSGGLNFGDFSAGFNRLFG